MPAPPDARAAPGDVTAPWSAARFWASRVDGAATAPEPPVVSPPATAGSGEEANPPAAAPLAVELAFWRGAPPPPTAIAMPTRPTSAAAAVIAHIRGVGRGRR